MVCTPSSGRGRGSTSSRETIGASSSGSAQPDDELESGNLVNCGSGAPEQLPSEKIELGLRDKE